MKVKLIPIFLIYFVFLSLATHGMIARADNSNEEFVYQQKKLNQVKVKNLKYKVAIGSFGEEIDIKESLFNKSKKEDESKGKVFDISISFPNFGMPTEAKTNSAVGMLSDLMKQTDMFDVIERQEVNQLVREIKFENSNWTEKQTANKLGNIYGVQYILLGDVLTNRDGERFGSGMYTAALRLVDVNTGDVVASGTGEDNYLQDALANAVSILAEDVEGEPWVCRVVRTDGDGIYINAGYDDGVEKNDVFSVFRLGEPIEDHGSKAILGYKQKEIAKIKITEVMENELSLAQSFDVEESIQLGDLVSAKRVKRQADTEIDKWNSIFGTDAMDKEKVPQLNKASNKFTKRSLPISSAQSIVDAYGKSVVLIQTDEAMGSGFVVSPDGLILTNSHVIRGSTTISIKFIADNRVYSNVEVIKDNTIRDIALLKINETGNFIPVALGDSDQVLVGEQVVAIGNPEGLENTVSDGLISAIRDMNGTKHIQISAPISSGSSGGALFNMSGEVIGIVVSSVTAGQNLNFAVAINYAKNELLL